MMEEINALQSAAAEFENIKNRKVRPKGRFDNGGRWYPDTTEVQPCCRNIRTPSRAFPLSLLTHCRSANHVATKFGVGRLSLLRAMKDRS